MPYAAATPRADLTPAFSRPVTWLIAIRGDVPVASFDPDLLERANLKKRRAQLARASK